MEMTTATIKLQNEMKDQALLGEQTVQRRTPYQPCTLALGWPPTLKETWKVELSVGIVDVQLP